MSDSALRIIQVPSVAGSDRGIKQSIQPLPNGRLRKKVSGRQYSTARPQFNAFKTTVYFEDIWPPAFGGLWYGAQVTLWCAQETLQPYTPGAVPVRPVVPGTLRYLTADSEEVEIGHPGITQMAFCMILEVFVVDWHIDQDEAGVVSTSDIEFSEVMPPDAELP